MKTNTPTSGSNEPSDPWLNTEAACNYLSVKKLTIYRWVKAKLLKPKRTSGGELRFRRSDLDALLS
jgi:excisionase family DNA binding protein